MPCITATTIDDDDFLLSIYFFIRALQAIDNAAPTHGKSLVALRAMFCTGWDCLLLQRRVLVSDMHRALTSHGTALATAGQSRLAAREWLTMHALHTQLCANLDLDNSTGVLF